MEKIMQYAKINYMYCIYGAAIYKILEKLFNVSAYAYTLLNSISEIRVCKKSQKKFVFYHTNFI